MNRNFRSHKIYWKIQSDQHFFFFVLEDISRSIYFKNWEVHETQNNHQWWIVDDLSWSRLIVVHPKATQIENMIKKIIIHFKFHSMK